MPRFHSRLGALAVLMFAALSLATCRAEGDTPQPMMPGVIQRFSADRESLQETYKLSFSPARMDRMQRFYQDEQQQMPAIDFDHLSYSDQLDYLLLKNCLQGALRDLALRRREAGQMQALLPFAPTVEGFLEQQRKMERPDAEATARQLSDMVKAMKATMASLDPAKNPGKPKPDPVVVNRAVQATEQIRQLLGDWYSQYNAYDPLFTWWDVLPYQAADKEMGAYIDFMKEKLIGISANDKTTIIGDPVGRAVLMDDLKANMIPYTPEELIAIAQSEYDWRLKQMLEASRQMGYGDNWQAAVEKVKTMHVPPGDQPEMIRKLLMEGDAFVKKNKLVTVPPPAEETMRMIMMTPQRQLVNPFFTGGDEISVSYPTDTMTFAQREMSMRGNSFPLAHATTFHEMIPGHFLQFYMGYRYHPYRAPFATPFWYEGNAFWWEMVFWDKGWDATPAEKVGALMWRMHRSARIIFTMNFQLGRWTPQQCVNYIMTHVGFDVDNATAEVRRSFDGSVGPLYQSSYLLGALQFRDLHKELVGSGKVTDRQFSDAVLHQNAMPVALLRAYLEHQKFTRDYVPVWKFYGEHPTHP